MNRRSSVAAAMLVGLVLAAMLGCASDAAPTVEVTHAVVADRTGEGTRLEVTLRVDNPTEAALPVREMDYRITVADVGTFKMTEYPAVSLPPNGEQTVMLPAAFQDGDATWVGRRVRVTGALHYQPPGQIRELLTEYHFPLPKAEFAATGELSSEADEATDQAIQPAGQ